MMNGTIEVRSSRSVFNLGRLINIAGAPEVSSLRDHPGAIDDAPPPLTERRPYARGVYLDGARVDLEVPALPLRKAKDGSERATACRCCSASSQLSDEMAG